MAKAELWQLQGRPKISILDLSDGDTANQKE